MKEKLIIYQVFPRILTNDIDNPEPFGSLERNGSGKMNHFTPKLLKSIRDLGCNAIWYTGIIEHATCSQFDGIEHDNPAVVKGKAGSPYAITDYYDVAPELAENVCNRMGEFEDLVRRTHNEGMKVLIDFVPNHTARHYHSDSAPARVKDFGADDDKRMAFAPSNNYYYVPNQQFAPCFGIISEQGPYIEFPAKATGNDCFSAFPSEYDWYETAKLNYGHDYFDHSDHFDPIPDTWLKMLSVLRFWASKGVDGFRCDMVFMVPLAFWHWAIPQVKSDYPNTIFIGEIYDVAMYRAFLDYGCFDYLYDKVNLYDTLVGIERGGWSAARITGCWQTVDGIGNRMLNFLENHDEVRFGSCEFAGDPMKVLPHLVTSAMISTGPFMIYYGQELGECALDNEGFAGDNHRTTIFDYWSYATMRRWYNSGKCTEQKLTPQEKSLRHIYKLVLNLCNSRDEIREGGFYDLMYCNLNGEHLDPHRQFAFIRYCDKSALLIIANFAGHDVDLTPYIPGECFEATSLPQGEFDSKDLVNGDELHIVLKRSSATSPIHVKANGAVVLEIKYSSANKKSTKKSK